VSRILDFRSVDAALLRYRIIALVVSVLLVVLFFVGIPLQYAAHQGGVDAVVGIAHGVVFYPLYLLLTLDLGRRLRMSPLQLVPTLLAGTVPLVSFYAERRTTAWVRAKLPPEQGAPAASTTTSGGSTGKVRSVP
jgi:integral membrane protein